MQNEMKLTDESWISYQQGKGNEEYQKYMEDLTDMQNHVLPYLQSGRKRCEGGQLCPFVSFGAVLLSIKQDPQSKLLFSIKTILREILFSCLVLY